MNRNILIFTFHTMSQALLSLWLTEYENGTTVEKASAMAAHLRNTADSSEQEKVLTQHEACLALASILNLDWWKCEHFRELYFALDAVADAFNEAHASPIPIWTYGNGLLSNYNGVESACAWHAD